MSSLQDLFSNVDPKTLDRSIKAANRFAQTAEGQKLMAELSKDGALQKKLKQAERSGVSTLSAGDRKALLSAATENPAILKKIRDMMR